MAEEDVPNDLDVRLEWPEVDSPPVTRAAPAAPQERGAAPTSPAKKGELVPSGRGARAGFPQELLGRMDALTRAVQRLQADSGVDTLSNRVEDLARSLGKDRKAAARRASAQAQRTGDQISELLKRVDALARTVAAIPVGAELAEMVGRVDALAGAVDALCTQVGASADRFDALRRDLNESFMPLQEATAEVRRLNDTVTSTLVTRSDRQVELASQIEALSKEIRSLRRRVPVARSADVSSVVEAVTAAVLDALQADKSRAATPKVAAARKRTGRASTATT